MKKKMILSVLVLLGSANTMQAQKVKIVAL